MSACPIFWGGFWLFLIAQGYMLDTLKQFDATGLKPITEALPSNPEIGLADERIFRSEYQKNILRNIDAATKAAKLLEKIPERGECYTVLMAGNFDGWEFVNAVMALAAPAPVDELYIGTLGFGDNNSGSLLTLLDEGKIKRVWFVASCYMRDAKGGKRYSNLATALKQRGQKCNAIRNHAKIICVKIAGHHVVIDGSCNLCGCRNVEQVNVRNDPQLFGFFAEYIRENAELEARVK